jgi:glycosyltransferase involved in cell wall biosynthesis
MRVLMLTQFYAPIIGGGAIHVRSLSHELIARGHDVAVVTLWHKDQAEFELDQGVRVYRVHSSMQWLPWIFSNNERQYAPPFPDPGVTLALRSIIMCEQPEIVHAHNWLVYSFLPLKVWSGAKLVVTLHNHSLACVKMTMLYQNAACQGPGLTKCLGCAVQHYGAVKGVPTVLSHRLMGLAERGLVDMFLTPTAAAAAGNGLSERRLTYRVIPNFISDDTSLQQSDAEPYLRQLPAQDYLLFVGALSRQKGVDVLLQAYAGLTNAPPLVLIGYQTKEWSLRHEDCPHNVFILKDWPRFAVLKAWYDSILGLLPSIGPETFGMTVMEAMVAGRPVIASRIGGLVDLVNDGESGLLVEPGNPLALQGAIERLLANPDLCRRMGQAALRKVVEYQASTVVPRIEQVYQEVLRPTGEKK